MTSMDGEKQRMLEDPGALPDRHALTVFPAPSDHDLMQRGGGQFLTILSLHPIPLCHRYRHSGCPREAVPCDRNPV